jgi:hypothetical protein
MVLSSWAVRALSLSSTLFALSHAQDAATSTTGYAADVIVDEPWDNSYPAYEGSTLPMLTDVDVNVTNALADMYGEDYTSSLLGRSAQGFFLRLMPLGASITEGTRSSDGNGYRRAIRDQLRFKGWKVNMVGSKQNGNMADKVSIFSSIK